MNRFGAAFSTEADLDTAVEQACAAAIAPLAGERPSLAVLFVSHDHADGFDRLARLVRARLGADHLIGCSGDSIVGNGREIEQGPCLALWVASFPEGEVEPFELTVEEEREQLHVRGFPGVGTVPPGQDARVSMVLLGDPYSFPADLFLQQLDQGLPGQKILGGMASGGSGPGTNALFLDDECLRAGAVGVLLRGIAVRHVVSQGCRPIGRTMVITKSKENVIEELAGKPPLEQLKNLFEESDGEEKELLTKALRSGGLHVGQVVDEFQSQPERGDFLVRNVMGIDPKSGVMHIGDHARRGRTIRFHVRDAASADEDLRHLLDAARARGAPGGALLFTCNGRGTRLFERPDHDAGALQRHAGPLPAAGFFCAGEIGPIGGRNFLHGFTASVALFDAE
ncbi:MAG: FIST C-terminal domain-containing protein [Planctomycetes bacterium]|nr:FIST C-terminal domain-containing protein [Planctomycetota bacterium]